MTTLLLLPYALAHTAHELAEAVSSEEHLAYNHNWPPRHWLAYCWNRSAEVYIAESFELELCYAGMSIVGIPVA